MKDENELVKKDKNNLTEKVDYYIENGNFVFTENYLKKRGYCCESGCRHCPYGFEKNNS
jgi:hypothetical protein